MNIEEELEGIKFSLEMLSESVNNILTSIASLYERERISAEESMGLVVKLVNLNNSIKATKMYSDNLFEQDSIEKVSEEGIKSARQHLDDLFTIRNDLSDKMFKLIEPD